MKRVLQIVLAIAIIGLGYMLIQSIATPIRFDKEFGKRKDKVIQRLKDIRTAQVAYKSEYGKFTGSFDTLATFLKTGFFNVEKRIGSADDSIAVSKGLTRVKVKVKVIDSLFKGNVALIDSLQYIPFGGGDKFEMAAGELMTASQVSVKVFEAKADYNVIFRSLVQDNDGFKQLLVNKIYEDKKNEKFPGFKVGSLTEATNNAGNWE